MQSSDNVQSDVGSDPTESDSDAPSGQGEQRDDGEDGGAAPGSSRLFVHQDGGHPCQPCDEANSK